MGMGIRVSHPSPGQLSRRSWNERGISRGWWNGSVRTIAKGGKRRCCGRDIRLKATPRKGSRSERDERKREKRANVADAIHRHRVLRRSTRVCWLLPMVNTGYVRPVQALSSRAHINLFDRTSASSIAEAWISFVTHFISLQQLTGLTTYITPTANWQICVYPTLLSTLVLPVTLSFYPLSISISIALSLLLGSDQCLWHHPAPRYRPDS